MGIKSFVLSFVCVDTKYIRPNKIYTITIYTSISLETLINFFSKIIEVFSENYVIKDIKIERVEAEG